MRRIRRSSLLRIFRYGLYASNVRGLYELDRYNAKGEKQKAQSVGRLLCGDTSLDSTKSACGCRVVDVSEDGHALLVYCRRQHGDYDGMFQRQWLSIFRSDELTGVGFIDIPKNDENREALANGEGHAYVLALEHGETFRVYAIPDRP